MLALWLAPAIMLAQGIEITSTGSIACSGAATIEISNGSFINNGTYTKGAETFTMSGATTPREISGSALSGFNNLTLSNTAGVSIVVNTPVTVSGTLTNSVGAAGLVLKSDATGYGSLIQSTASVQGTAERQITATTWTEWNDGWHLLSSPVAAQAISGDWTPAGEGNDYDFYAWSESATSDNWLNQKVGGNGITAFVPGQGYLVAYEQTDVKAFAGVLNVSAVSPTGLTHTTGNDYAGWHLAGNPFSSAINWNTGTWTKTNLGANAKIWAEADKSYKDVTSDYNYIIPAQSGFMVYVNESATGALTIPADARVHNTLNWLKSVPEGLLVLTARETEGNSAQETLIRFNGSASIGFDPEYDSKFMAGFAPVLYTIAEGSQLSCNTLPEIGSGRIIQMGFVKNNASSFSIELSGENQPQGFNVYLTDKKTGQVTALTTNPVYHFVSAEGDDASRFTLHFSTLGVADTPAGFRPGIYAVGKSVRVSINPLNTTDIHVRSITGQLLRQCKVNGDSSVVIDLSCFPAGVYVISVTDGTSVGSSKVILK